VLQGTRKLSGRSTVKCTACTTQLEHLYRRNCQSTEGAALPDTSTAANSTPMTASCACTILLPSSLLRVRRFADC